MSAKKVVLIPVGKAKRREYLLPERLSELVDRVGISQYGSMTAVSKSGIKTMSLFSTTAYP